MVGGFLYGKESAQPLGLPCLWTLRPEGSLAELSISTSLKAKQAALARQGGLLDNLPALHDSQVAWLLLSCCTAPRAQYALRTLPLESTRGYAAGHDGAVLRCLSALLFADEASQLPEPAQARAQLALRHGGLGLRSATRHAPAAYWASWADALHAIARRDPGFARESRMSRLTGHSRRPCNQREMPDTRSLPLASSPLPGRSCCPHSRVAATGVPSSRRVLP